MRTTRIIFVAPVLFALAMTIIIIGTVLPDQSSDDAIDEIVTQLGKDKWEILTGLFAHGTFVMVLIEALS